jgi:hypothetical protein
MILVVDSHRMEVEFILRYHDRYIDEDDAVRSDGLDDWLIVESTIFEYGSYSNRGLVA